MGRSKKRKRVKVGSGAQSAASKSQKAESNQKSVRRQIGTSTCPLLVKSTSFVSRSSSCQRVQKGTNLVKQFQSSLCQGMGTKRGYLKLLVARVIWISRALIFQRDLTREIPIQTPLRFSDTLQIREFTIWILCYHFVILPKYIFYTLNLLFNNTKILQSTVV